jgi:hypothetical protein
MNVYHGAIEKVHSASGKGMGECPPWGLVKLYPGAMEANPGSMEVTLIHGSHPGSMKVTL